MTIINFRLNYENMTVQLLTKPAGCLLGQYSLITSMIAENLHQVSLDLILVEGIPYSLITQLR